MNGQEDVGLEFEVGGKADARGEIDGPGKNVRHWFRVPVEASDAISVTCGGQRCDVVNFSKSGVAIRLPQVGLPLAIGEMIPSFKLILSERVMDVEARVVSSYYDEDENRVYGLNFVHLGDEAERQIDERYWQLRNRLFSNE
jgi:hypothetical protein